MKKEYNLKRYLSIVLAIVMFISCIPMMSYASAGPTSGSCGKNVKWSLNTSDWTLTISGSGDMTGYSSGYKTGGMKTTAPWGSFEDSNRKNPIKTVVIEDGVTSIGDYAFFYCKNLESVEIADSVTSIGYSAFRECSALRHIDIPETMEEISPYAFSMCRSLEEITIPDGVTSLGYCAFYCCDSLREAVLPSGIDTVDDAMFSYCSSLESVVIPDTVTNIGSEVFSGCTSLESIDLPESLESMSSGIFADCESLESIVIPGSVTYIDGYMMFDGCTSLKTITFDTASVPEYAYIDAPYVETIIFNEGVTSIGDYLFGDAPSIETIVIPETVEEIGEDFLGDLETENLVIFCSADSTADEFAKEKGLHTEGQAHTHTPLEAVSENIVEATCTEEGSFEEVIYCEECGEEISREVRTSAKLSHTPSEAVIENETASTCSEAGTYDSVIYCAQCGEEISRVTETSAMLEHVAGEIRIENEIEAGCTTDGSYDEVVYCAVCGEEMSRETTVVEAHGHVEAPMLMLMSAYSASYVSPCERESSTPAAYCMYCGEVMREAEVIPAKGHIAGKTFIENEVAPTCDREGAYDEVIYCTVCGEEMSRNTVSIPALGHKPVTGEAKAPTCTKSGKTESSYCSVCGEVFKASETIPSKGHTDNNRDGKCDICSASSCDCMCHKSDGFSKIIYMFVSMFWNMFGTNVYCACGIRH